MKNGQCLREHRADITDGILQIKVCSWLIQVKKIILDSVGEPDPPADTDPSFLREKTASTSIQVSSLPLLDGVDLTSWPPPSGKPVPCKKSYPLLPPGSVSLLFLCMQSGELSLRHDLLPFSQF